LAALRIAKLLDARVIATSSDDAKLAAAKQLGADVTLNHRSSRSRRRCARSPTSAGVDVVVENVGAATWDDSLHCLRRGGRLRHCGATSGPQGASDLRRLFWHQWSLLGSTMGNAAEYAEIRQTAESGTTPADCGSRLSNGAGSTSI